MRADTIEHEPMGADPIELDAEDVTADVTADAEPEIVEEPV